MSPRITATALAVTLVAVAFGAPADAARLVLPAPSAADLVGAAALTDGAPAVDADREPVAVAWPLPAGSPLRSTVAPFVAASREHWFRVTAAELDAGIDPAIASRGAIVRLSPLVADRGAAVPVPPSLDAFEVTDEAGVRRGGPEALAALADPEALAAAGVDYPDGSTAVRLRPELGDGPFRLRVDGVGASGAAGYLVHVFEPESAVVLTLAADRSVYAAGGAGEVVLALENGGRRLATEQVVGFVQSPGGHFQALQFTAGADGRLHAGFEASGEDARGGLWQAEVAVTAPEAGPGGGPPGERRTRPRGHPHRIRRTARTAFAVPLPTARLAGEVAVAAADSAGSLAIDVPIEVGSAGRYAVRAIVAERRPDGARIAIARAESAAWLEPGAGALRLVLDAEALAGAGPGAPLELVELELVDPGRLGLLERRALEAPLDTRP